MISAGIRISQKDIDAWSAPLVKARKEDEKARKEDERLTREAKSLLKLSEDAITILSDIGKITLAFRALDTYRRYSIFPRLVDKFSSSFARLSSYATDNTIANIADTILRSVKMAFPRKLQRCVYSSIFEPKWVSTCYRLGRILRDERMNPRPRRSQRLITKRIPPWTARKPMRRPRIPIEPFEVPGL